MNTNLTIRIDSKVKRAKEMPFAVTATEEPTIISHEKMLADADRLLAEFASDYERMAKETEKD